MDNSLCVCASACFASQSLLLLCLFIDISSVVETNRHVKQRHKLDYLDPYSRVINARSDVAGPDEFITCPDLSLAPRSPLLDCSLPSSLHFVISLCGECVNRLASAAPGGIAQMKHYIIPSLLIQLCDRKLNLIKCLSWWMPLSCLLLASKSNESLQVSFFGESMLIWILFIICLAF